MKLKYKNIQDMRVEYNRLGGHAIPFASAIKLTRLCSVYGVDCSVMSLSVDKREKKAVLAMFDGLLKAMA